jgi:hypothetical protein
MRGIEITNIVFSAILVMPLHILYSCPSPNCRHSKSEYHDGYAIGKMAKLTGGAGNCDCYSYVNSFNKASRYKLKATDCFCEGFEDGFLGKRELY